ncbi:hypothetical protein K493DRAFT_26493 [Basidiobolus meristosporus CBS 931.73]|uniref:Up-regulated during septation protein 1 domain-containing protein n=1 Tax=Basidiobolus meristosporus CBS 931.73 TaxID=1314790 RepID=A0A1Y1YBH4_9FUNG|nr:hypothetical protein K493DRAFT_26493 [Basidiobolus meristosporus CBS 931.73]|eukprot:ORX95116.1 hypothetical protein K493DRAFT_26493 [Basidiobolus meristosporus CBS 931.73]
MRMRDGAATLVRAQSDKKLARKARDQFENSERRVGQLSSEIWRLSQSANYIHQKLLEHTAATLGKGYHQGDVFSDLEFVGNRNSQLGDDAISTLKTQLAAMSSKLDAIIDSKEGHPKPPTSVDTDSGVGHEHKSWYSLDHRKLWELEKDETIHTLTEQVSSLQAELQLAQSKVAEFQRKCAGSDGDNTRVNELIRSSLKNAIVEKERYKIELEKEKALREDLSRQLDELHATVQQSPSPGHENRDKAVDNLRTKLEESISDIDLLREENEDIKDTLRQLFVLCPNYSPSHTYSEEDEEEKFTMDGFVNRVSYLIEENHHLMDRVLDLQSENERHRVKSRRSRNDMESIYESPVPTPTALQARSWLEESSDEEHPHASVL